jgi:uncharacterized membrane protein YphA (DoxX/SURF4 family)
MLLRRIARPLLSAVFIGQGVETLRNPNAAAEAVQPTLAALRTLPDPVGGKVPADPEMAARVNAAVQVGGGVLLAIGRMPRLASLALACTVVPGSLGAHVFWNEVDAGRKAEKRHDFLTDLSLLGGLIIASADTEGRPSLGWRGRRAAGRISEAVTGFDDVLLDSDLAEKVGLGVQAGAERGRELASAASERGVPLVRATRKRGEELAESTRKRGEELAESTRERGMELADTARKRVGRGRRRRGGRRFRVGR